MANISEFKNALTGIKIEYILFIVYPWRCLNAINYRASSGSTIVQN